MLLLFSFVIMLSGWALLEVRVHSPSISTRKDLLLINLLIFLLALFGFILNGLQAYKIIELW